MGRLRKKAAGKARESRGMRRRGHVPEARRDRNGSPEPAAMTKDEAQRSIRTFYEAVIFRFVFWTSWCMSGSGRQVMPQEGKMIERAADEKIARVVEMIAQAKNIVVFTGAGVSTESGIPDFRSPGGIWTRFDPGGFTIQKFMSSEKTRKMQWQMLAEGSLLNG